MSIPIKFFSFAVYFIGFPLDFSLRKLSYLPNNALLVYPMTKPCYSFPARLRALVFI